MNIHGFQHRTRLNVKRLSETKALYNRWIDYIEDVIFRSNILLGQQLKEEDERWPVSVE